MTIRHHWLNSKGAFSLCSSFREGLTWVVFEEESLEPFLASSTFSAAV